MINSLISKELKQLHRIPKKEKGNEIPHLQINRPNVMHEIDVLYLPNDNGHKYLLTVVDVSNSRSDFRALKTLDMGQLTTALDDIYEKSSNIKFPVCIQADNQFNTQTFKQWCKNNNIKLKITEPYSSRQQAHVESLNRTLGMWVFKLQQNEELKTQQTNTEWVKYLPQFRKFLNEGKPLKKPVKPLKFTNFDQPIIDIGTIVRVKLNKPIDVATGKLLNGKFRATDIKWSVDKYKVIENYVIPNNPILYKVERVDNGKIINHLLTAQQLQII